LRQPQNWRKAAAAAAAAAAAIPRRRRRHRLAAADQQRPQRMEPLRELTGLRAAAPSKHW